MVTKIFEVRDRATHIGAIATRMVPEVMAERYELRRCGYSGPSAMVMVVELSGNKATYDPFKWRNDGNNTMFTAHQYIQEHFDDLESGAVIDTEYIRGESTATKESEGLGRW